MKCTGRTAAALAATAVVAASPSLARAQLPLLPVPQGPVDGEQYQGAPVAPRPLTAPAPPRHPAMAPNGRSNLHEDAYQTDVHRGAGPLGRDPAVVSAFYGSECASITFDSRGRIVTVCVGLAGPTLRVLDPTTLETLGSLVLPPRVPDPSGNVFTSFGGGGYFYLDDRDRAIVPTTTRHVFVVDVGDASAPRVVRDLDLSGAVREGDSILSALPDWAGRLWFVSRQGVVGWAGMASGAVHARALGEPIGNSFAVDEHNGVYVVSDRRLYRFEATRAGFRTVWRAGYANVGTTKPGQTQAGSGTTPTLIGRRFVAITDNADPMNVLVLRRDRRMRGPRRVCRVPVFAKGASATDQSLIATPSLIVVENNFGYSGPAATEQGKTSSPGLTAIRMRPGRCRTLWRSRETAPSVVPKLSVGAGLVYTYTKDARADGKDPWWFTAIDARDGRTRFKVRTGEGLGFNNNYAPVTIGPDGSAYVGVLGGIVRVADRS
jgi:hypothetical protein